MRNSAENYGIAQYKETEPCAFLVATVFRDTGNAFKQHTYNITYKHYK